MGWATGRLQVRDILTEMIRAHDQQMTSRIDHTELTNYTDRILRIFK